ncbi:glycosyltransferase family 4 protein [Clostridium perfringens]|uniref:glycosyltransferase family 4 protein n=1 Tax=Clostridium perfringens TaxID=1502 RepID=UPI002AC3E376|nr:glycosyltransferase [Clostridium perfringens]MDZ5026019.1 glycosyltransferase [Clostridium perfringens]
MKKILYISDFILEKNIGAHKLTKSHLRTLRDIVGYENVDVIALTGRNNYKEDQYFCIRGYENKFQKVKNFLELNSPFINNKIINTILKKIDENKYNVVFVDNSTYGKLVKSIKRKFPNIKVISFYHDVKRNLCKLWLKEYGVKYFPDYIVNIYNEYLNSKYSDFNITLNNREDELFFKYYKKRSDLNLPIYMKKSNKVKEIINNDFDILFVGAYYYPNVKGIEWFCNNVMNNIKFDCNLYIVGKGMEAIKSNFNDSRIHVVGTVEDISIYYNKANVVIAPIFDGAGMKVKTAEAFMFGKNFIGTDESLVGYWENLDCNLKSNYIFLANTKEEYINYLNLLYENKSFNKMNKDVCEFFLKNYSDKVVLEKLKKIL